MTNFDDFLAEVHTVAIGGHIRPDGDCVGSCLATYNYIKTWYPDIDADGLSGADSQYFQIYGALNEIVSIFRGYGIRSVYRAGPCGDTGHVWAVRRISLSRQKHTVCGSPHQQPKLAQDNHISRGQVPRQELVYELLQRAHHKGSAECIYTGMVHDTQRLPVFVYVEKDDGDHFRR